MPISFANNFIVLTAWPAKSAFCRPSGEKVKSLVADAFALHQEKKRQLTSKTIFVSSPPMTQGLTDGPLNTPGLKFFHPCPKTMTQPGSVPGAGLFIFSGHAR
jgi:hypothetical protein